MPTFNVLVQVQQSSDPEPKNWIVNTFNIDAGGVAGADPGQLAQDTADLWASYRTYPNDWDTVRVKLYDMAALEPRPIAGEGTASPTSAGAGSGPREVALCLSYYREGRNLPRNRGRMYIGPWTQSEMMERAPISTMQKVEALALGLQTLGGTDVDWWQFSPTAQLGGSVTDWWVDNEWDTVRSRGLDADQRLTGTTSEG